MKVWMLSLVVVAIAASSVFSKAEAMTAEKVIENMIVSYDREMKDVEDYTIVTDNATNYFKRTIINGRTVYKVRNEMVKLITIYDGVHYWQVDPISGKVKKEKMDISPYQIVESLKTAQIKYAGTEKIDGHKTHILDVKNYKMMGTEGMQKVNGRLWVDARDYVIRKMEMDMEIEDEKGEKGTKKITIRYEDFRKVNGMLMPYRTVVTMPMLGAIEISPEEEAEMRKGLEEMQKALAEMSPEERAMMEAMMKPQIEMMEKMLAAGGIETVTVVKDVKVNTGLSDELFDGSKLR